MGGLQAAAGCSRTTSRLWRRSGTRDTYDSSVLLLRLYKLPDGCVLTRPCFCAVHACSLLLAGRLALWLSAADVATCCTSPDGDTWLAALLKALGGCCGVDAFALLDWALSC